MTPKEIVIILAMISSIGILTSTTTPMSSHTIEFADHEKCTNGHLGDFTARSCGFDKDDPILSYDGKKECREKAAKCSISKTGFGEFDNEEIRNN
jgi:hypothetical protein